MLTPSQLLDTIRSEGGVSIPSYLTSEELKQLLGELSLMKMTEQSEEVGPYSVRQSFSSATRFITGGAFVRAYLHVESSINEWFSTITPPPLCSLFQCTDIVVQRYPPGPIGLSAHRDGASFANIIAVLVLEGSGRFAFCDDRNGSNPRSVRNEPGDLILMRGVGFDGSDFQPFHFVDSITSTRTTFAMRQRKIHKTPS